MTATEGQCTVDSNLYNIPVDLSHMSSVFAHVNSTTVRNYGALVVNAQTGPILQNLIKSVDH